MPEARVDKKTTNKKKKKPTENNNEIKIRRLCPSTRRYRVKTRRSSTHVLINWVGFAPFI